MNCCWSFRLVIQAEPNVTCPLNLVVCYPRYEVKRMLCSARLSEAHSSSSEASLSHQTHKNRRFNSKTRC